MVLSWSSTIILSCFVIRKPKWPLLRNQKYNEVLYILKLFLSETTDQNFDGIFLALSSKKVLSGIPIRHPRWPPSLKIETEGCVKIFLFETSEQIATKFWSMVLSCSSAKNVSDIPSANQDGRHSLAQFYIWNIHLKLFLPETMHRAGCNGPGMVLYQTTKNCLASLSPSVSRAPTKGL